jgi:hypothetical protein
MSSGYPGPSGGCAEHQGAHNREIGEAFEFVLGRYDFDDQTRWIEHNRVVCLFTPGWLPSVRDAEAGNVDSEFDGLVVTCDDRCPTLPCRVPPLIDAEI